MRINKIIPTTAFTILPMVLFAADAAPEKTGGETFNATLISLVSFAVVLLIAILVLGNTLKHLGFVYRDKMRKDKASGIIKSLVFFAAVLSSFTAGAENVTKDTGYIKLPVTIGGLNAPEFYAIMGIIALELIVILALVFMIRTVVRLISGVSAQEASPKAVKINFWDRFNKVVPLEKEQDILLDHNYDGIQELDNSLPPWWKYGFYLTIVVGVIYIWYYHAGGNGPSSYDEYVAEVQAGDEAKAAYLAKSANNVDENSVKVLDAVGIAEGEKLFQNVCAACHLKDGGGSVGPNLTDEYWLHGGGIKNVFKSIKYGWPDKGMKSWKDDFSPNQIAQIASYVISLKGTKPAVPKEKQGELYTEDNAQPADSSKTTTETKTVALK